MAFTALTAAQTDANSPIDQTLMDLIRTNFDDHETRIGAIERVSVQDIRDEFTTSTIEVVSKWELFNQVSGSAPAIVSEHAVQCATGGSGSGSSVLAGHAHAMRADMTEEYVVAVEWRAQETGTFGTQYVMGLNDAALTGATTLVTDISDFCGFYEGSASTWKFRTAEGGTATETDSLGAVASWTKFRMEVTCSGTLATRSIKVEVNDVEIAGSPFGGGTALNLPDAVTLRPAFGAFNTSGASKTLQFDYIRIFMLTEPVAA